MVEIKAVVDLSEARRMGTMGTIIRIEESDFAIAKCISDFLLKTYARCLGRNDI